MHTTSIYLTTATLLLVASGLSLAIAEQPPQEVVSTSNNQAAAAVVNNNVNANGAPSVESAPAVVVEHHHASTHHSQAPPAHYAPVAPAGVVQVVGEQQQSGVKPQPVVGSYSVVQPNNAQPLSAPSVGQALSAPAPAVVEQYGQPESAAMPPNYRAFGGWGLYIGGQPADGYYSSYYKALSSSVDKQQQQQQQFNGVDNVKPALSPLLRQANVVSPSSPSSLSNGFYPNDYYTPADLNSGLRVPASGEASSSLSTPLLSYSAGNVQQAPNKYVSPVQAGAQVYGTPFATYEPVPSVYATTQDSGLAYGTKKSTTLFGGQKDASQAAVAAKGYQQQQQQQLHRYGYVYSPALSSYVQQAAAAAPQVAAQQVVAYPVPVGSQIVGSQPGVEGSYQPYGVYGFTRYAIKPTVVATEHQQTYYHQSAPIVASSQFPVYKQQHVHQQHHQHHQPVQATTVTSSSYPQALSFYGYPLSQLHYASSSSHLSEPIVGGQVVGVVSGGSSQQVDASPVDNKSSVVDGHSSDLSSSSSSIDKQQVVKQNTQ